jgi:hypothetical protein
MDHLRRKYLLRGLPRDAPRALAFDFVQITDVRKRTRITGSEVRELFQVLVGELVTTLTHRLGADGHA